MSAIHVEWEGESYEIDFDDLDLEQAIAIQKDTGLGLLGVQSGCMTGDPLALKAAYWVMLIQNGKDRAKIQNIKAKDLKIVKFANALQDGLVKQAQEAEEKAAAEEGEDPKA